MSSCAKTQISHPRSTRFGQWTLSWEICTISLCTGEPFPEYHCLQYPEYLASHRRPSLSTSTAPSSSPCLTFPYRNNDPLVFLQIQHVFHAMLYCSCCFLWLQFLLPTPSQSLHLNGSNSPFNAQFRQELSPLERFLWNPTDPEILLEFKGG